MKILELSAIDLTLYKFVLPLMKELRNNGFDVICGASDFGYSSKIEEEGFKTYDIAISRNLNPISLLKSFFQLVHIFKVEKVDILHVHTPIASIIGRLAALFANVKIRVYTVHGFVLRPIVFYYVEKFMAKVLTSYMLTVNKEDLDTALKNNFIPADKIININSVGIDVEHFNPNRICESTKVQLKESIQINKSIPVIGYVGRIVKSKGVLDLVHAFVDIKKDYDCKLLLIGPWDLNERSNEAIIGDVRRIITENHMEQDILLLGQRENIVDILSIIDIFVLPSYREGMPVSLLEAMAMEKAVIGTNIRGIREEITSDSGLIYEPNDVEGLKKHIRYYLNNPEAAIRIGMNARRRVIDNFSIDKVIEKQMKVFLGFFHDKE